MRTALFRRLRPCCAIALAVAAAALTAACAKPASERRPSPNVLLITVDTLRADAIGAYGNRVLDPVDRSAGGGRIGFTQARASAVVTLPSHATILSGLYPFRHGVRENAGFRFPPQVETLATLLRARHFATGAFVSAFPLDARFGLTRGFDVYDDRFPKNETAVAFRVPERRGSDRSPPRSLDRATPAPPAERRHVVRVGPRLRAAFSLCAAGAVRVAVSRRAVPRRSRRRRRRARAAARSRCSTRRRGATR